MKFLTREERDVLRETAQPHMSFCTENDDRVLRDQILRGNAEIRGPVGDRTFYVTARGRLALLCFDALHGASVMA